MAPRRSHRKSRQGCTSCKRRRVKCDESGPPCRNCVSRGIDCSYSIPFSQAKDSQTNGSPCIGNYKSDLSPMRSVTPVHQSLLELELMHRWSTVTYKSLVTPAIGDDETWQKSVPKAALKSDFLLNGVFALAACEIAYSVSEASRDMYVSAAFDFQDRAIRSYQSHLRSISDDNQDGILYFSMMLLELTMASAQLVSLSGELDSKVQRMLQFHELVRGAGIIMLNHKDRLRPYPEFKRVKAISALPEMPRDPAIEIAIARLKVLNETRVASDPNTPSEVRFHAVIYESACKKALFWLDECFSRCDNDEYRMWCLGFITMSGDDYVKAIKHRDPVALLILMYWAVLVQPLGRDYWWAKGFGKSLIDEIAESLPIDINLGTTEVVQWARERICIEEMSNGAWPG